MKTRQKQPTSSTALFRDIPSDYRISGLAFQIAPGYARSADGDWYRVQGRRWMKPVMADEVDAETLRKGRERVAEILSRVTR